MAEMVIEIYPLNSSNGLLVKHVDRLVDGNIVPTSKIHMREISLSFLSYRNPTKNNNNHIHLGTIRNVCCLLTSNGGGGHACNEYMPCTSRPIIIHEHRGR